VEINYYDRDDNIIRKKDSLKNSYTRYKYTYNKKKQVTKQVIVTNNNGVHVAIERQFSYDAKGNVAAFASYTSYVDTLNIALPLNLTYSYSRKYDAKNRLREENISIGSNRTQRQEKRIYTYKDTLIASCIVINPINGDTTSYYINSYSAFNKPTEQIKLDYKNGKRYMSTRETYQYNADRYITECLYYSKSEGDSKPVLYQQLIFTYEK
jgi:hypothetical protein